MTTDRESVPMCCDTTVAIVRRLGRAALCPVCQTEFAPSGSVDVTEERPALLPGAPTVHLEAPSRPCGAQPDARVQVATEERLRPSSTAPVARLTHVEAPEIVRVRQALCELRPDASGPLGWGPSGAPSGALGSNWTPVIRVQTSVEVPAILPGAFAGAVAPAPGSIAAERVERLRAQYPEEGAVLRWMQRHATLAEGLGALYVACALAKSVSPQDVRDAWAALPENMRTAARLGYGRRRIEAALRAWWGEAPDATTSVTS